MERECGFKVEGKVGMRRFGVSFVRVVCWTIVALPLLGCGKSGSSGSRPSLPTCAGSGLVGDTFDTTVCAVPPTPTDDCTLTAVSTTPTLFPTAATSTTTPSSFEAEASLVVDRGSSERWAYLATTEAILGPTTSGTPASCIIEKAVKVYRSRNGGNWEVLGGMPVPTALGGTNPANPTGIWITDPWVDVASDGTLFVSIFADQGTADCATTAPVEANDRLSEVQLFTMPRGSNTLTQVATTSAASCGTTGVCSAISVGTNRSSALARSLDHPRMAVSRTDPNLVVVTWLGFGGTDFVRTLTKDGSGTWNVATAGLGALPFGNGSFAQPAFDKNGDLYIAHVPAPNPANTPATTPVVHRFHRDTSTGNWTPVASGGPTVDSAVVNTTTANFTTTGASIAVDPTPAIVLRNFPQNDDPILYMAYTVNTATGGSFTPAVHLTAVNANGLATPSAWLPPVSVSRPGLTWAQAMDVDPAANTLDLLYYGLDDPMTGPGPGSRLNTYWERRLASNFSAPLAGPLQLTATGPLVSDLPARSALDTRVFPGEYVALASSGDTAIVGFPFTSATPPAGTTGATNNIDLDVGGVQTTCAAMRTLSLGTGAFRPDNVWECDCDCGGVISNMVGCAAGPLGAADACEQVCVESDCGEALSCPVLRDCVSTGVGRRKFTDGCALESGEPIGSNPALFADFFGADDGGSHATFHFDGDSASTRLSGSVSLNVSEVPPAAGTTVEIARLQLSPHSFDVGGLIGARVRGITVTHLERMHGVFTDATHFTVPALSGELLTEFTIDPDGPSWLTGDPTTSRRAAYNESAMQGTLDLATNKLALSVTIGAPGEDMVATFSANLSAAPVDSDGDGVVDPLDNCPDVPNPTQVDDPPVLSAVTTVELEQCTPSSVLTFVPPTATDVCTPDEVTIEGAAISVGGVPQDPPVFLTNNEGTFPSAFPSGDVIVRWTATDGNGHTSFVDQTFQLRADHTGPVFDLVPPDVTTAQCSGPALGQPAATDSCGGTVTFSKNAPSKFPLGSNLVTWTATDARGNTRTATQRVTVLLGNDAACCPAGTNVIVGTSTNNTLTGTNGADCILALGGQDTINGNGGNDFISGGEGNDIINGGDGNDMLFGGTGQDTVNGNNGNDTLFGGDGDDTLVGGPNDDVLRGGQGQDLLQGQDGNDQLFGETGTDNLQGGNGDDVLAGGEATNDSCDGGVGANVFEKCELGAPNSCSDASLNGSETAVDCGGGCASCADTFACAAGGDCLSNVCSSGVCQGLPGGIAVKIVVDSDFGSGYCVHLDVTNDTGAPTVTWSASLNMNGGSIYTSWKAAFTPATGVVGATPTEPASMVIAPGLTSGVSGFCANRSVQNGSLPFMLSAAGSY